MSALKNVKKNIEKAIKIVGLENHMNKKVKLLSWNETKTGSGNGHLKFSKVTHIR